MEETKTIVGIITDKKESHSKPDAEKKWHRVEYTIMDYKFSTFSEDHSGFNMPDLVEVEYTLSGNYKNIKSMKKSEAIPPVTAAKPIPPVPVAAPAKTTTYVDRTSELEANKNTSIILSYACKLVEKCIEVGKIESVTAENIVQNIDLITERLIKVYKKQKKELMNND